MNFEPTAEQSLLRATVRRFVQDNVAAQARQWDIDESFPHAVVSQLGQMGLLGVTCDTAVDGAGLGATELALVVEEVARGDGGLALTVASHNGLCAGHIRRAGTPEQKARYLKPLARGAALGAWALTEPDSGSDAVATRT